VLRYDRLVPALTLAIGAALIVLGLGSYGLTHGVSLTALIPAAFGILFVLAGLLGRDPGRRMHAMHGAVVLALIGFAGSIRGVMGIGKVLDGNAVRPAAIVAQTIMAVLTLVYIVVAVRSFISARRARRAAGALILVLGAGWLAPAQAADLRVMTYNIKHGLTNAAFDLQQAIEVIRQHEPDVVALQEVDRFWSRSAHLDEPAVLSASLGMTQTCYGPNLDHQADDHADRPHQYGTLVLSRHPITSCGNTLLPRTGTSEQRGLTLAVIDVQGVALRVYNTHLHVTQADRLLQTEAIARALDAAGPDPVVLAGDFNATPAAKELAPIVARFTDAWDKGAIRMSDNPDGLTSPAELDGGPRNRIDYVFVSPSIQVRGARVVVDAKTRLASDHYPVVVDIAVTR
jgi:endonuclease/exonuclease/phosphatase family metal-dependent hydrolase